jgi:hypothetical protein
MSLSDTTMPLISAPWLNAEGNPLSVIPFPAPSSAASISPVVGSSKSPRPSSGPRSRSPLMMRSGAGLRKSATESYRVRSGVCFPARKSPSM